MKPTIKLMTVILGLLACMGLAYASDPECEYSFVHMSDPQYGFLEGDSIFDRDMMMMDTVIRYVNHAKPPFVVITGDFVNQATNRNQIDAFKNSLLKIDSDIRIYLVPGNHDIGNNPDSVSYERYCKNYGDTRFSFTYCNDRFIGIDSNPIKNGDSIRESEQYEWLVKELAASMDARHRFIFMHHPIFLKRIDEKETYSNLNPAMRAKYLELFGKYGVDIILTGHYHNTGTARIDNIRMYTAGAVGRSLGSGFSGINMVRVEDSDVIANYIGLDQLQ